MIQRCLKLNKLATLLAFSPAQLHNVVIHDLDDVLIQGPQILGVADL